MRNVHTDVVAEIVDPEGARNSNALNVHVSTCKTSSRLSSNDAKQQIDKLASLTTKTISTVAPML